MSTLLATLPGRSTEVTPFINGSAVKRSPNEDRRHRMPYSARKAWSVGRVPLDSAGSPSFTQPQGSG